MKRYLCDLGEVSFLKLRGINHENLSLNHSRVEFGYQCDLDSHLKDYWNDKASIPPRLFKMTLDNYKRLVHSYLRSQNL